MQKQLFLFILLFVNIGLISAEDVTFQTNVPSAVVKGEQFRLTYILKNASGSNGQFPTEIKGIDMLYGPSVSQSRISRSINGQMSSESSESYTFVLMANETGTYTIPSASITANGKTYTTRATKISVLPPDKKASQSQQAGSNGRTASSAPAAEVKSTDAFIRPIVTKTKVHEQEAFMISFRFYTTALNVRDIGKIEFPEFEGFMVEEVDLPVNRQLSLEHYNGRNYYAVDLKKSLLFPQRSGKITIPKGKLEMVFSVPSGRRMESFFGTQDVMTDVNKVMTTNPITIDITPLPEGKPASFANAVGTFNLNSKISETNIKANDAVTITLTISGTGNLKLVRNPEIKFPKDFETYDPKVNNDLKLTGDGLTGTKTIEYLFIPRHQGKFTIPAVEFSYFDPKSKEYKTLKSKDFVLNVEKDPNASNNTGVSYTNQSEVNVVKDIRFLKTGDADWSKENSFLIGSVNYLLWYIIPIVIFIIGFVVYRKQIRLNANISLMKTKKANKVAAKRLKLAETYLKSQNKEKFYEEVLRAVWGYLSDKLTIPVSNLNRENIEQELSQYGVQTELTSTFLSILNTCEFARYAPAESDNAMDKIYTETVDAIGEMENMIKKKK